MEDEPRLPPELERAIFELVAISWPVFIPNLLLVASRVRYWVHPLLHRTLTINAPTIPGLPPSSVATFTHIQQTHPELLRGVKNLMILHLDTIETDTILSACPNVQNLYILLPGRPAVQRRTALDAMPLRHLYCELDDIGIVSNKDIFSSTLFGGLTHLELYDIEDEEEYWTGLAALPRLTHLAFDTFATYLAARYKEVLERKKDLKALIVLRRPSARHAQITVEDKRFVMMPLENYTRDWQCGVLYGDDFWARADKFIAGRIAGLPPPDAQYPFYLSEDGSADPLPSPTFDRSNLRFI
ncbi:hypothetical protein FB45DRAFT_890377 [Roridomyces roridus]|uniref:Uncharacterized protein n=1 Tax=Roridomyces roridus TaxID=1738132 RepID=A0AAD7FZI2_9AGAR|nr:hypothetical protein FB45DRAFT_890377 [Roridomyces roridus]